MFWRNRHVEMMRAEIAALKIHVKVLEDFAFDLCSHVEDLKKRPRIAQVLELDRWQPPDVTRPT
jgi:hypothetical protein